MQINGGKACVKSATCQYFKLTCRRCRVSNKINGKSVEQVIAKHMEVRISRPIVKAIAKPWFFFVVTGQKHRRHVCSFLRYWLEKNLEGVACLQ